MLLSSLADDVLWHHNSMQCVLKWKMVSWSRGQRYCSVKGQGQIVIPCDSGMCKVGVMIPNISEPLSPIWCRFIVMQMKMYAGHHLPLRTNVNNPNKQRCILVHILRGKIEDAPLKLLVYDVVRVNWQGLSAHRIYLIIIASPKSVNTLTVTRTFSYIRTVFSYICWIFRS